ncbi:hypothetical protein SEA_STEPMIH_71 [Mycobacterium phage StepMih]|uniref:Gp68-like predicted RNA polymerase component domain-containing protein n=1 Tax=Mycobacterium phage StepMih TaxID=2015850 RepID=A0A286MQV4_9CAUD|nr:hypothetical protein SEA_STEPMIH_71 [Mycobacterium phage StepMih]
MIPRWLLLLKYLTENGVIMKKKPNLDDPEVRSWLYRTEEGPHESAAVLRMHRAGYPGPVIMKTLQLKGTQLMQALNKAITDEQDAASRGRAIHDALIARGAK